jgi:hypothetical protein
MRQCFRTLHREASHGVCRDSHERQGLRGENCRHDCFLCHNLSSRCFRVNRLKPKLSLWTHNSCSTWQPINCENIRLLQFHFSSSPKSLETRKSNRQKAFALSRHLSEWELRKRLTQRYSYKRPITTRKRFCETSRFNRPSRIRHKVHEPRNSAKFFLRSCNYTEKNEIKNFSLIILFGSLFFLLGSRIGLWSWNCYRLVLTRCAQITLRYFSFFFSSHPTHHLSSSKHENDDLK